MKKKWNTYGYILIVFIICGVWYIKMNPSGKKPILEKPMHEKTLKLQTEEEEITSTEIKPSSTFSEIVESENFQKNPQPIIEEPYIVYVCGEVQKPSVYSLPTQSRMIDALMEAGGPTEDADLNRVNLADKIVDGQKIYIPKIGEDIDKSLIAEENSSRTDSSTLIQPSGSNLININQASQKELESLPGIGPVIAQNIIAYREQNGMFRSHGDIKKVSRIGSKTYEKIKDLITVQ
jgi:competence protein ComEA